jgi:hypothetical protein
VAAATVRTDAWPATQACADSGSTIVRAASARYARRALMRTSCRACTERSPTSRAGCAASTAGVSRDHLQVYLDEFVFRFNRRGSPMAAFQTLLGLGTVHSPTTYEQITRRNQAAA